jgi:hypothetical protein
MTNIKDVTTARLLRQLAMPTMVGRVMIEFHVADSEKPWIHTRKPLFSLRDGGEFRTLQRVSPSFP